jgi:hypothetical protein
MVSKSPVDDSSIIKLAKRPTTCSQLLHNSAKAFTRCSLTTKAEIPRALITSASADT